MKRYFKPALVAAVLGLGICAVTQPQVACAQSSVRSEAQQLRQLARQIGVNTAGVGDQQLVAGFQEFGAQFGIRTAAQAQRLLRVAPQGVVDTVARELQQKVNEARAQNQSRRINQRNVRNQRVVVRNQQPQVIVVRQQGGGFAQALNTGFNVAGNVLNQAIQLRALRDLTSTRGGNRFLRNALILQALQGNRGFGGLRFGGLRFRIGF